MSTSASAILRVIGNGVLLILAVVAVVIGVSAIAVRL